ncbi:MAG: hypothetical protein ACOC0N_12365 [Chroococcales cyanobacterium]
MIRYLGTVLGIGAAIAAFMPIAQAQEATSGVEVVRSVDNREIPQNAEVFFPELVQQNRLDFSNPVVGRRTEEEEFNLISEDIRIELEQNVNRQSDSNRFNRPLGRPGPAARQEQIQVLYEITEW